MEVETARNHLYAGYELNSYGEYNDSTIVARWEWNDTTELFEKREVNIKKGLVTQLIYITLVSMYSSSSPCTV